MTAISHVSELLPDLASDLAGCSQADKLAELDRAARELCDRSRVWRTRVSIDVAADATDIALDTALFGARAVQVLGVLIDGIPAYPFCVDEAPRLALAADGSQYLSFASVPVTAAWVLTLDLVLKPGPLALAPAWLLTEFGDTIAAGAMMRLKRQAKKPYTDYDGAEFAAKEWSRGVGRAAQVGAERMVGVDATGVAPVTSAWTVGEGTTLRSIAGDNPTYADLVKAVRTLMADLVKRGVL